MNEKKFLQQVYTKLENQLEQEVKLADDSIEISDGDKVIFKIDGKGGMNYSQVSRHKKAHFFGGAGYFVCSQYKASASFGVSILSVPCGLFVL